MFSPNCSGRLCNRTSFFFTEESMSESLASAPTASAQMQDLEDQIQKVMEEWKVPGLALLIMKGDEVVLSRGFGKRNVAQDVDVTSQTLFPIGSCSKAMTAAAIAMLVEEGKLEWDK